MHGSEQQRLSEDESRAKNWKRWGPYLSERQWGTVREDYSPDGDCWHYLTHDHSRSRAYRWGEDGLLGWTDRECRLCFAPAFWNGQDPILKERIFGLINSEGNHGEDVKEIYYFLDATPTHAYQRALYKYPQRAFPYDSLVRVNAERSKAELEYEITDTDAFHDNRYFDIYVEYAKGDTDDTLIQITAHNRGLQAAPLHILPTVWFRNTWSWGRMTEDTPIRPELRLRHDGLIVADHATLGSFLFLIDPVNAGQTRGTLFTENETNYERVFGAKNSQPFVKDAFHEAVVNGRKDATNPGQVGTKCAFYLETMIGAGESYTVRLRLVMESQVPSPERFFGEPFTELLNQRKKEADDFFTERLPYPEASEEFRVMRQAQAGLLWTKQFYYYEVERWFEGDPGYPPPPASRYHGRNVDWQHVFNRDVLSMPDSWEYPWYAAWDLAFHCVEFARVDPAFAKGQLTLLLREWYLHPNGQVPAYEFAFSDVNPPVHAWAAWRVYKITGAPGKRDIEFLERVFQKLMLNFTWWVNRKDSSGRNLFAGGFLGLDNIGVFDRSKQLRDGNQLEQADGTAWMASYCLTMLVTALELALHDPVYEDIASKFFEHFVAITNAINSLGGTGLWDEQDGFYYDRITTVAGERIPLRIRSIVGLLPMIANSVTTSSTLKKLPQYNKRVDWFMKNKPHLARYISELDHPDEKGDPVRTRMLSIPSRDQLVRMLRYMLDEKEFLSPYGIRSISRYHLEHPFRLNWDGEDLEVKYEPGESSSGLFGGNSNWRGPIWFPVNYLLVESLERYHHFYGETLQVECPVGSGKKMNLLEVSVELRRRLASIFLPGASGERPYAAFLGPYANDPLWRDNILFNEYFHGDTGRGVGANHQTGWTALAADFLRGLAQRKPDVGLDDKK